jgi:hypothetical protein
VSASVLVSASIFVNASVLVSASVLVIVGIVFACASTALISPMYLSVGGCWCDHVRAFRRMCPGAGVERGDKYQRHGGCEDCALAEIDGLPAPVQNCPYEYECPPAWRNFNREHEHGIFSSARVCTPAESMAAILTVASAAWLVDTGRAVSACLVDHNRRWPAAASV